MPQMHRIGRRNTRIIREGLVTRVRLYSTDVVTLCPEEIDLNTGGWDTATTRNRMNQAANQFNLNYHVYQKKGQWYCHYKDHDYQFSGHNSECIIQRS